MRIVHKKITKSYAVISNLTFYKFLSLILCKTEVISLNEGKPTVLRLISFARGKNFHNFLQV